MIITIWLTLLLIGFVCLWKGADFLIEGSTLIAHILKVPEFLIGITLIAFGTSLPELVVNIIASKNHQADIVFGNVIGSNIANTLLIIGACAVITPLVFKKNQLKKTLPLSLLAPLLLVLILWGTTRFSLGSPTLNFRGGILLLFGFVIFIMLLIRTMINKTPEHSESEPSSLGMTRASLESLLGIILLIFGGKIVIVATENLAFSWGLSEGFIALFLIAFGTSLPELITSVVGGLKGKRDMVIGNIIGSNVFNVFLVLGVCSLINPLPFPKLMSIDLSIVIGSSILVILLLLLPKLKVLTRWKGYTMLLLYSLYITMIFLRG